jgi:hypothetical protein
MALNFSTKHLDSIQAMNVENAHTLPAFTYSEEAFENSHYKPHFFEERSRITAVPLTLIPRPSDRYSFDHHVEGHLAAKPSSLVSQINSAARATTSAACF